MFRVKEKQKTIQEILYLTGLSVYVFVMLFQTTYLYNDLMASNSKFIVALKLLRYLSYLLCVIKIVYSIGEKKKKIFFLFGLCAIVLFAAVTGSDKQPIFIALFLLGSFNVEFDKVLRLFLFLQLGYFFTCLISCFVFQYGAESIINTGRERFYLGFGGVNRASYIWLFMLLEYVCIKKGKLRVREYIFFELVALWIYKKTVTRYAIFFTLLAGTFFMLLYVNSKIKKDFKVRFKKPKGEFYCAIFVLCALLGIGVTYFYNGQNAVLRTINRLTNSRLSLGRTALDRYPLSISGHKIVWTGISTLLWGLSGSSEYFYVDCGYLQTALDYGLLFLFVVMAAYVVGIYSAANKKEYSTVYCIVIIGLICIFEPRLVDFGFNPFILYSFCDNSIVGRMSCSIRGEYK